MYIYPMKKNMGRKSMKRTIKTILCLLVFCLIAAGCSSNNAGQSSVLEFFGFNQPTDPNAAGQTAQNTQGKSNSSSDSQSYSSLADLDWDESIDPALIEPDVSEKNKDESGSAWEDDPFANSFSPSSFEDVPLDSQQKQPGDGRPPGPRPGDPQPNPRPNNPNIPGRDDDYDELTWYFIDNNPVFRPMCELPRTGLTAGQNVDFAASVNYAPTSMSLSIPTLNVNEKIVIVPLEGDNFPVEALGEKIGLLEGSGPGPEDLFVLAGHNHLNTQEQGPFVKLSALKESDLIFVTGAKDASRTFVVYANEKFAADDIAGLLSYARPGCMILITCEDESIEGGYVNRRVVFAEAKTD